MEALALLKFWKSTPTTTARVACGTTISTTGGADYDNSSVTTTSSNIPDQARLGKEYNENNDISDSDDDEESFFELELRLPDGNLQNDGDSHNFSKNDSEIHRNSYDSDIDSVNWTPINRLFEKSKPHSPISTLRRSATPKLRVLMFGKLLKSKVHKSEESEAAGAEAEIESVYSACTTTPPRRSQSKKQQQKRNLFTVKLKMDDASVIPKKFTRSNSSRISTSSSSSSSSSSPKHLQRQCVDFDAGLSKRFSKDSIQKYFNLIKKPLNVKSPRNARRGETVKVIDLFSGNESTAASFPSPSSMCSPKKAGNGKESKRFRVVCKHLGKSKSASAMPVGGASSPASRHVVKRNEEGDGIEGAILHCKRSLNSTCKEPALLSRCTSDPSHEKSILMMSK